MIQLAIRVKKEGHKHIDCPRNLYGNYTEEVLAGQRCKAEDSEYDSDAESPDGQTPAMDDQQTKFEIGTRLVEVEPETHQLLDNDTIRVDTKLMSSPLKNKDKIYIIIQWEKYSSSNCKKCDLFRKSIRNNRQQDHTD